LAEALSRAVVDAGAGLDHGLPFPAGPLRVPLARQWPHVHGLELIGTEPRGEAVAAGRGRTASRSTVPAWCRAPT
jgi:tetraacyldisaccharide 4'-kinase